MNVEQMLKVEFALKGISLESILSRMEQRNALNLWDEKPLIEMLLTNTYNRGFIDSLAIFLLDQEENLFFGNSLKPKFQKQVKKILEQKKAKLIIDPDLMYRLLAAICYHILTPTPAHSQT